jgi:hypothetical protein
MPPCPCSRACEVVSASIRGLRPLLAGHVRPPCDQTQTPFQDFPQPREPTAPRRCPQTFPSRPPPSRGLPPLIPCRGLLCAGAAPSLPDPAHACGRGPRLVHPVAGQAPECRGGASFSAHAAIHRAARVAPSHRNRWVTGRIGAACAFSVALACRLQARKCYRIGPVTVCACPAIGEGERLPVQRHRKIFGPHPLPHHLHTITFNTASSCPCTPPTRTTPAPPPRHTLWLLPAQVFFRIVSRNSAPPLSDDQCIDVLLGKLQVPISLVWGESDPWIRPQVRTALCNPLAVLLYCARVPPCERQTCTRPAPRNSAPRVVWCVPPVMLVRRGEVGRVRPRQARHVRESTRPPLCALF